jgi:hypothetical protein
LVNQLQSENPKGSSFAGEEYFSSTGVKMKKLKAVLLGVLACLANANADDIYLGQLAYNGNGCPINTVSATLSPDRKQLSVLFNEYIAEAIGKTTVARKNCNLVVPVHVPNGLSLSVFQVDYRGYNSLPRGADSVLSSEYFFANMPGPKNNTTFRGQLDDEYYLSDQVAAGAIVWSACGATANLRINTALRVKTNSKGEQALSTVDSVDLTSGLVYHLQFRKCN